MIAIKNMEMPKSCKECPMIYKDEVDYRICTIIGKNIDYGNANEIHQDCPLVEIQEPRTGYWVSKGDVYPAWKYCSNCNEPWTFDCGTPNYCPNCGAKMAESEEV